jgi:hypothetical protein
MHLQHSLMFVVLGIRRCTMVAIIHRMQDVPCYGWMSGFCLTLLEILE